MQGPQSRDKQDVAATRWIANATIALLPVLACFLGGATQKWEEGLIITLLALCLLVRPPRFSLGTFTNVVLILAQRPKFRSIPKSESNRDSFRARRDRDSCLRSGRSSQAKKTVDRLDPGAGPDRGSDHFEFFALWNRDPHDGQRVLAGRVGVPTTLSLATRAWNLSFSSSFATHGAAAFRRPNTREISSSRFRQHRHRIESPVANFS